MCLLLTKSSRGAGRWLGSKALPGTSRDSRGTGRAVRPAAVPLYHGDVPASLLGDGALAQLTFSYSTNSPGETRWGMQRRSKREDAPHCCQGKHLEEDLPRQPDLAAPACPRPVPQFPTLGSSSHPSAFSSLFAGEIPA